MITDAAPVVNHDADSQVPELEKTVRWLQGSLRDLGGCPDGGTCHHACDRDHHCARKATLGCVPLSGSRLTDDWELPRDGVVLAADHKGMRVDHSGMLKQAGHASTGSGETFHKFMLDELGAHMREMGERYYAGDTAAVDEFLQLYCVAKDGREAVVAKRGSW